MYYPIQKCELSTEIIPDNPFININEFEVAQLLKIYLFIIEIDILENSYNESNCLFFISLTEREG